MNNRLLESFYSGNCFFAYKYFGAHLTEESGISGVRFTVYAPKAKNVQVIGEFNEWIGENHQMVNEDSKGTYTLFIPEAKKGMMYKYRIHQCTDLICDKCDPYGFYSEFRPNTASYIVDLNNSIFTDDEWMKSRCKNFKNSVNVYELHLGSWKKPSKNEYYTYMEICDDLITYIKINKFTHIEIMPLNEHPFDGSWGYQASGYFSPTSRYGNPQELMMFINKCHQSNIGVILDFVPVHFVRDNYSLAKFDGSHLYEYEYEDVANNEWGSCNFNYYNPTVVSFLMSAATFWLETYHIDGLRMDAISNAIYWQGDSQRGVNIGGVDFLRKMNYGLNSMYPNVMLIAEDSSNYTKVTAPTLYNGLGFDYKWDLGWMNDTLNYFATPFNERKYNHNLINFSMSYFYYENYFLCLSHDEVVHGKKTVIDKIWGTYEEKFAQYKTLYTYMFTHPGKKLNFMGNEIAQFREWDESKENDWSLLKYPSHDSFNKFYKDLCKIYSSHTALYEKDYDEAGYKWIDADNKEQSVYSYIRYSSDEELLIVINMSDKHYKNFRISMNYKIKIIEILNSNLDIYGGTNIINSNIISAEKNFLNEKKYSILIDLPPFTSCIFKLI
ncbi:1,4-alpha-glucan branching protein GlgB [Clostridium sp. SHJSY1]|uniref:1,4-alpha-glucan branching protein GlgB n=1 Tax=Clostridium sp. SHJSY1 TaxID=2942483 RepID=UPI002874B92C|nr:1,4-alpha-glucan branching protein GlgB [Clostridium sp. SHJSY1]MDS0524563.1 1,4-alpha-glucan branching protein GlgB [Clostridium sp. SHJSY1]